MSLRAANVAARRQRVLDTALDLIVRDGLEGLSMRKLADEVQLSVRTLYNQFGSRTEILRHVVDALVTDIERALEGAEPTADPLGHCRAVMTTSIALFERDVARSRAALSIAFHGGPELTPEQVRVPERGAAMIQHALEAAIAQGLLRDVLPAATLAAHVYENYEMACARWVDGRTSLEGFRLRALFGL
ncbi:MAG: TetR/AcrR family transcriptional regulator, partial [Myxococcota bacterium]